MSILSSDDLTLQARPLVGVLAIVGVGLIGGSFGAALRQSAAVGQILGVGRPSGSIQNARKLGLIDEVVTIQDAAERADLIMLATPVGAYQKILEELKPYLRPVTRITDAGSTKVNVVAAAYAALGDQASQFVPGHPIAGAETPGPQAADAGLYRGRTVVLTPLSQNSQDDRHFITAVWEKCGARVVTMEAEAHDVALASVSHVPHFLASVFMGQVAAAHNSTERMALAGTGFRDFTRIAAGSAEMWRDIFLTNREAVLTELQEVKAALSRAELCLQNQDAEGLYDFLERAALARRFWGSRSGMS